MKILNKEKKNIIFYPYINAFGGIERLIIELAKNIPIILVCYYDKIDIKKFNENITVVNLNPTNYFQKFIYLKKFFNSSKLNGYPLMWGYKAAFFAFLCNINNYVVFIDDPPSLLSNNKKKNNFNLINYLRNKISRVIRFYSIQNAKLRLTQTRRNSLELKNKFRCKFNYFYPGIDFKIYDKIVKSQRKINLLSICRIEKNKKINWLLQSIIDLKNDNFEIYKKIKLDIVGDGSEKKKLKYFCKKNKIINKVSFLGFVNETKKKNLLKNNHIFLIPAEQGYGIPALEALHYHNKLIINKESRISEIFKNNKGIKITCNNYSSFYSSLKLLLKDKNHFFKPNIKILPKSIKWVDFILRKCRWKN